MQKKKLGLPSIRLLALAAAAGMIAGAGAVYMTKARSGNGAAEIASLEGDCAVSEAGMETLKPLIKGQVAALIADTPRKFADISFKDGNGKVLSISDFKGETVLLNLWATWCGPCRAEMPALDKLQKEVGSSDKFEVVAINIDTDESDEKPRRFLQETGVEALGFYRDNSLSIFNKLKKEGLVFGLPSTMLLDAKGCLVAHMNGPAVWDGDDARALIDAIGRASGV